MILNFVNKLDKTRPETKTDKELSVIVSEEIFPKLQKYLSNNKRLKKHFGEVLKETRFAKPDLNGQYYIKSLVDLVSDVYVEGYFSGYDEAMDQVKKALIADLDNNSI